MTSGRSALPGRSAKPAVLAALALLALAPASAQTGGDCLEAPTDPGICLLDDRFRVTVDWKGFPGNPFSLPGPPSEGAGEGVRLEVPGSGVTPGSGYFWFSSEDDVELIVKMVDGRPINGKFWLFYGSLTNVEYEIRVVDTMTDQSATYRNEPGDFTHGADTAVFPIDETAKAGTSAELARRAAILPAESLPSCDDPSVACVHAGRFAIQSAFHPSDGGAAIEATPVVTTATSAVLAYFDEASSDVAVKVVDGRDVNDSFWIFVTSIGASPAEVTVTDLETGKASTYAVPRVLGLAVGDRQPFAPDPPDGPWLETAELPGFRFKVRVTGGGGEIPTRQEADCVPETLCISGAVPGRSELFLRIVGPKPNGFLQPNLVKFSTSQIEVWAEQVATGLVNYYELDGAGPASSDLSGFFDRFGFGPGG